MPGTTPSAATTYVTHSFAQPATPAVYAFNTDLDITQSADPTRHDSFGFTLRTTAGAPVISIDFVPATTGSGPGVTRDADDAVQYTTYNTNGTVNTTGNFTSVVALNSIYSLGVTIDPGTSGFSATLTPNNGGPTETVAGGALAPGYTGSEVTQVAATWTLLDQTVTGGQFANAGDNALDFDNYQIAAVPEPSTYVASGLISLVGLAGILRRRRQVTV